MSKDIIHLVNGKTVLAEVNGLTMNGQRGFVLIAIEVGNLYHTLRNSREIEVEKRTGGSWWEVNEPMKKQACMNDLSESMGRRSKRESA